MKSIGSASSKIIAAFTSVLLASATLSATPEMPQGARFIHDLQAGRKVIIVTMGTSLTGGTWRWPDVMMGDWLTRDFPGLVTLINEGVGASSTAVGPDGNKALSGLGKLPAVIARKPDVVFIEFGTNDAYRPYGISLGDRRPTGRYSTAPPVSNIRPTAGTTTPQAKRLSFPTPPRGIPIRSISWWSKFGTPPRCTTT